MHIILLITGIYGLNPRKQSKGTFSAIALLSLPLPSQHPFCFFAFPYVLIDRIPIPRILLARRSLGEGWLSRLKFPHPLIQGMIPLLNQAM
jgi:hypothetical protein